MRVVQAVRVSVLACVMLVACMWGASPRASASDPADALLLDDVPKSVRAPAPFPALAEPSAELPASPGGDVLWTRVPPRPSSIHSPDALAEELPGRLAWDTLDPIAYAASVTAAREGLRLLQGPMTAEQHRRYEEKWLPYYDLPTPEVVAYLAKLLPLLERVLAGRAGVSAAAQALAATLAEAGAAAAAGDTASLDDAMLRAQTQQTTLEAYRSSLFAAVHEIELLGNLPDPYASRRKQRRSYNEAVGALQPLEPMLWIVRDVQVVEDADPRAGKPGRVRRHGDGFLLDADTASGAGVVGRPTTASYVRWRVPRVVPYGGWERRTPRAGEAGFEALVAVEVGSGWDQHLPPKLTTQEQAALQPPSATRIAAAVGRPAGLGQVAGETWIVLGSREGHGSYDPPPPGLDFPTAWRGRAAATLPVVRRVDAAPATDAERLGRRMAMAFMRSLRGTEARLAPDEAWRYGDWLYLGEGRYELVLTVEAQLSGIAFHVNYVYELVRETDSEEEAGALAAEEARSARIADAEVGAFCTTYGIRSPVEHAILEGRDPPAGRNDGGSSTRPSVPPTRDATEEARQDAIRFQQDAIRWFEGRLRRDRAEYESATDPVVRRELLMRMLSADADANAARDHLTRLTTGEWIRTRTAYDAWNHERMIEIGREQAERFVEPDRVLAGVLRQVALLPTVERAAAREDLRRALAEDPELRRDPERLRRLHGDMAVRVRMHWSKAAADERLRSQVYRAVELGLEGTKISAGIALLGFGGWGVSAWGGSATAVWASETLLGAAYGGATGYVEGGVVEASRQSLQWAGMVGFTASEAIEGYRTTGSARGAGDRAAKAWLMGKALELGMRWGVGVVARGRKLPPDVAAFQADMTVGAGLVETAARSEWALAEATSRGAPTATVQALTRDARLAAAAVQASYCAKLLLKRQGPSIAGAAIGARVEGLVAESLDDLATRLEAMGYANARELRFQSFRNASSAGTFGMDVDLGLVEVPGIAPTRAGRRVSLATLHDDAQQAMNAIWRERTGHSAEASFINLTTSKHREAFARPLLSASIPFETLTIQDMRQAAETIRTKVAEIDLPGLQGTVERCRTLEKEMRTKMIPYLEHRLATARATGDAAGLARLDRAQGVWEDVYRHVESIGRRETDPGTIWRLARSLEAQTGGKTVTQIASDLASAWETMVVLR